MTKRSTKFYRKNEAEVMKALGLKPTKNSGAGWIEKSDGQNDDVIAELKSTDARSIRVDLQDINILNYHASVNKKLPVFIIQFLQTHEVFLLVKPIDIKELAEYITTGNFEPKEIPIEVEDVKQKKVKKIKSNPKSRDSFWEEREKEWLKNGKKR